MIGGARRWVWLLMPVVVVGGLLYGGWRLLRAWRHRTALVAIREKVQNNLYGLAARDLTALLV